MRYEKCLFYNERQYHINLTNIKKSSATIHKFVGLWLFLYILVFLNSNLYSLNKIHTNVQVLLSTLVEADIFTEKNAQSII